MSATEITQKQYEEVMGENPSWFQISNEGLINEEKKQLKNTSNNPVETVNWYDAIYFCNKLSERFGFIPVYSVNGTTDVTKWNYTPHEDNSIYGVTWNKTANGFRLPTVEEWQYAAKGGQNYTYSGSDNLDEVGWYLKNSGDKTHSVAQKKANGYGLYDMSGNVWEWCWDVDPDFRSLRYNCGGGYRYDYYNGDYKVSYRDNYDACLQRDYIGFRIVCSASN
ncbi:formylglycine-generating enzyme family protein [Treponema sp.]|uniref:formylglycine-generating enzyme family protein n=1 Tax=Treponema sp. TaxID=166 RepID=UPI00298DF01F|nr:SUMF1/EgtB/PvdO family nonheme iron enzyme [Treponema sp.]